MMRWWWFGPDVENAELDRELTAMAAGGLGGVEVAFVYPLSKVTTPFLSDPFLAVGVVRGRPGTGSWPAVRSDAGQRLAVRRPAHHP